MARVIDMISNLSVAEVEVDGFGVADMEDAIRFGRESGPHLAASHFQVLFEQSHCIWCYRIAIGLVVLSCLSKYQWSKSTLQITSRMVRIRQSG